MNWVCTILVALPVSAQFGALLISTIAGIAGGQEPWRFLLPEQRCIEIRDPATLPKMRLPDLPNPPTVTNPQPEIPPCNLSLDEALRTALANSEVIRLLGGSSGQTIYDPAIVNTEIDQARAVFDPNIQVQNNFFRRTPPVAGFVDPRDPSSQVLIEGTRTDSYNMGLGLSKQTITGGTAGLAVDTNPVRVAAPGLPLNPETSSSVDLSFTQPLLQGGGVRANVAPILIGRIDTERSSSR